MKKILVLAASNSSKSINKRLAIYAGSQLTSAKTTLLDLNDYEMPIYSSDREERNGIPDPAKAFADQLVDTDGIILSLAEHNGSYSVAFKNILDWVSRLNQKAWDGNVMLLMSTSPGGRGGMSVLETAVRSFPHFGANVAASFSLPSFQDNFSEDGILNSDLVGKFNEAIQKFTKALEI